MPLIRTSRTPFARFSLGALLLLAATWPARADFIAYVVPAGTDGNQLWGGPLGMDFNVNKQIIVTALGVFDDDSNGLTQTLTARLYDRTNTAAPLVSLTFTPADPGTLIGGSRFKDLPAPLSLMPGFQGCIVAVGYGGTEENGNGMGGGVVWTMDSGGGAISFVGSARYGFDPNAYPPNVDGGPANRYAAGTFAARLPEPATLALLGLGGLAALVRRRRAPR